MKKGMCLSVGVSTIVVFLGLSASAQSQQADMTFFVTSAGPGKGGDLGGLAGADAHCQSLAQAVGAGNKTWRAYLSTNARGGANPVQARDRIGNGPWKNAKGVVIATSVIGWDVKDFSPATADKNPAKKNPPDQQKNVGCTCRHGISWA